MELFIIISFLIVISAAFMYVNYRYIKLPSTIGLMIMALVVSVVIVVAGTINKDLHAWFAKLISHINLSEALLDVMLSFLLFAGSLHIDLRLLREHKGPVISFSTFSTLVSTVLFGVMFYYLAQLVGIDVPFIYCILFGALISPTDPVAVLGIMKKAKIPKKLEIAISGESLFNDGVGVVLFVAILEFARGGTEGMGVTDVIFLFLKEAGGGIFLGVIFGYLVYRLMMSIDHYQTEVTLSIALVMGTYSLASLLHLSGPLAMVSAGLLIGNTGRSNAMSDITKDYIDKFWEVVDDLLNALLFVMIGLELVVFHFLWDHFTMALVSAILLLIARWVSVSLPILIFKNKLNYDKGTSIILTWGGLRGGISIALALSLPDGPYKEVILSCCYVIVIFSIIVQGLSLEKLVKKILK